MTKRAFSRAFDMPTIDPDKEDECKEDFLEKYLGKSALKVLRANYRATAATDPDKEDEILVGDVKFERLRPFEIQCPIIEKVAAKSGCDHSWTSYTGLSESFEFCRLCDEKR